MLSLVGNASRLCDGFTRREVVRVGGLTLGGLSLPRLLQSATAPLSADGTFSRAKNVIFLYLAGGPPQHETFDPKPDAPLEIRGAFRPIQTNIAGIQFCELLPRTALLADKLAVIRSMATDDNTHSSSSAWVLTGYKYRGPNARTISPDDWPYFGSIVKMLRPSESLPGLSTVWVPDMMRLNENVTPAGQTGGFLGSQWGPEVFVGDPSQPQYEIESLRSGDIGTSRLGRRRTLLETLESPPHPIRRDPGDAYEAYRQQAFDLLTSGNARQAFEIAREPDLVRDRYGRNRWGQCVLLARRLIEAGVRLVHVQWPREPGDNAVDNPLWDTHAQNADRVEDVLCPMFDVGYSALIEDLDQRGLLDETLVVAIGEFGRTPQINGNGGRDHWGPVFSCALAGAGIRGGQLYGASDKHAAYPIADRVEPGDLTATIFHLLGIHPYGSFPDREGREHRLTGGEPLYRLLGSDPSPGQRVRSDADPARVPRFDPDRRLAATDFSRTIPSAAAPPRPKGWRAAPGVLPRYSSEFGLQRFDADGSAALAAVQHGIGVPPDLGVDSVHVPEDLAIAIAQEVRSPFAGTYRFRVRLRGEGQADSFDELFRQHFACRLVFFQFNSLAKSINDRRTLADVAFQPQCFDAGSAEWQTIELAHTFQNPNPGANFSFGAGMGVAIEVARKSSGTLAVPAGTIIRLGEVELEFDGKPVDPNVTV